MSTDCLFSTYRKLLGLDTFMWFRGQLEETLPRATWQMQAHGRFALGRLLVCKMQSKGEFCPGAACTPLPKEAPEKRE